MRAFDLLWTQFNQKDKLISWTRICYSEKNEKIGDQRPVAVWGHEHEKEGATVEEIKRGADGDQRGENKWELEAVVCGHQCPSAFRSDMWLQRCRALNQSSVIHRHYEDKMKSFESNFQDNRLRLYRDVDQCWAASARPEKTHFPSSSARNLTLSIIKTNTLQCRPRDSISMILLPVCTSSFLCAPHCLCHTAKIDGKSIKEGDPLAYNSSLSYTQRGERNTERCSLGIPSTVGTFYKL